MLHKGYIGIGAAEAKKAESFHSSKIANLKQNINIKYKI